jgi:hypothetical protein
MMEEEAEEEEKLPPEVEELLSEKPEERKPAQPEERKPLPPEAKEIVGMGVRKGLPEEELRKRIERIVSMSPEEMLSEYLGTLNEILSWVPDSPQKEALRGTLAFRKYREVTEDPVSARMERLLGAILPVYLTGRLLRELTRALEEEDMEEKIRRMLDERLGRQTPVGQLKSMVAELEELRNALDKVGELGKGQPDWLRLLRDALDVVRTGLERVPRKKVTGAPA